jgi:probable F420-dependent oxidoreductase
MEATMKLGVIFPQTEIGTDPLVIKDYGQAIEGLGFAYLLTYDHVLGANPDRPGGWQGPYTYQHTFHEPLVLFGYLAGLTTQLEFVTGILILPQRQTPLVAKQAAEVDVLSGGRLRLGVGVGWNQVEMEGLGYDFDNRGQRIEEQITVLRQLWTQPLVNFKGSYHTLNDVGINPLPVQRPIPLWLGGMADVVLQRAARLADGWFPNRPPKDKKALVEKMWGYVEAAGRSRAEFGIDPRVSITDPDWESQANEWQSLGVTHLCINTMGAGFRSMQEHLVAVEQFKGVAW